MAITSSHTSSGRGSRAIEQILRRRFRSLRHKFMVCDVESPAGFCSGLEAPDQFTHISMNYRAGCGPTSETDRRDRRLGQAWYPTAGPEC
jgi:hypothetical protein